MLRRLLNLLTAVSLLLCVAMVALWVRSYFCLDELRFGTARGWLLRMCSYDGRIQFLSLTGWPHGEGPRWRSAPHETGRGYTPELPRLVGFSGAAGDASSGTWHVEGVGHGYSRCRTNYSTDGSPPAIGTWSFGPSEAVTAQPVSVRWRTVKHWTVTWTLLVLPAVWLVDRGTRRAARRSCAMRRRAAGLCQSCSYDLAGNASGVCPECGTPAAADGPAPEKVTGVAATLWSAYCPAFTDRSRRRMLIAAGAVLALLVATAAVVVFYNRPEPPRFYTQDELLALDEFGGEWWRVYKPPAISGPYRLLDEQGYHQSGVGESLLGSFGTPQGRLPYNVPGVPDSSLLAVGVANKAGQHDLFVFYRPEPPPAVTTEPVTDQ